MDNEAAFRVPALIGLDALLDRVLAAIPGPVRTEQIPAVEGLDRVLAEPVVSSIDLPPWDASAIDGYAVRAADAAAASAARPVTLRVIGELRPGSQPDRALGPGECARIAAGTPLPGGADAVAGIEQPRERGAERCVLTVPVAAGDGVRRRGADVRAGTGVLQAGTLLRPAQLALAGAVGEGSLCVHRRPVAGILSTGAELRFPGQPLGPAGVPDANRPGLLTRCRQGGVWAVDLGIAGDSLEAVSGALAAAVERSDAIVVTGGVATPPYDVVRRAFEAFGAVEAWRIEGLADAPFAFGVVDAIRAGEAPCFLFGLPGNPAAAFIVFELVVTAALARLSGRAEDYKPQRAVLESGEVTAPAHVGVVAVRNPDGRPALDEHGRVRVTPAADALVGGVTALASVDAVATVRESARGGTEVEIRWLTR